LFYFNVIFDDFLSILMMENLGNIFKRLDKSVNTFFNQFIETKCLNKQIF